MGREGEGMWCWNFQKFVYIRRHYLRSSGTRSISSSNPVGPLILNFDWLTSSSWAFLFLDTSSFSGWKNHHIGNISLVLFVYETYTKKEIEHWAGAPGAPATKWHLLQASYIWRDRVNFFNIVVCICFLSHHYAVIRKMLSYNNFSAMYSRRYICKGFL